MRTLWRGTLGWLLAMTCVWAPGTSARAQATSHDSPVQEAIALRDRKDFVGAAQLLRPWVRDHPDDEGAARVLAQLLYWLHDVTASRDLYEGALSRHPSSIGLRLDYGRMLLETGANRQAREVVLPLVGRAEARGGGEELLGTMAYWEGDYSTAVRWFGAALAADSGKVAARDQLRDIRMVTSPWLQLNAAGRTDTQVLDGGGLAAEVGWYPTPLTTVALRVEPWRLRAGDSLTRTIATSQLAITHYTAAARVELEGSLGLLSPAVVGTPQFVGRAGLGKRLPGHFILRGRVERAPYLYSTWSLATPVMTTGGTALLHLEHPRGWLGEAALSRTLYDDDNGATSTYAWLLVPLARGPNGLLRAGYAASWDDADESRFVPASNSLPSGNPQLGTSGRYDPYFTPARQVVHRILAAVTLGPAERSHLSLDGGYGVEASDDSPTATVDTVGPPGRPQVHVQNARHSFSPWTVRGALTLRPTPAWQLNVAIERDRTVFYTATRLQAGLTRRFIGTAPRTDGR